MEITEVEIIRVRIRTVKWEGPWDLYRRASLTHAKSAADTQASSDGYDSISPNPSDPSRPLEGGFYGDIRRRRSTGRRTR